MPIAVLVLALAAYAYLLIAYPEHRRIALAAGALAAVGLGLYFLLQGPSETERAVTRIATDELTLDQIDYERTPRGATVTGRVLNGSDRFRLRDMTLLARLHDCPDADAAMETCPVIGEATAIARSDVPAGQIRAFSAHFAFSGVPPVAGTLRPEITVTATRATDS